MTLKFATGINFSWGLLFFTQDGGKTWVERTVPLGEPVDFINENVGWVAGGPMGNQLFKTEDGGLTWQAVQVVGEQASSNQFILKLPVFSNEQEGFIPVLFLGERRTDVTVYVTTDGGTTWTSTDREVMQQAFRPQNIITLTTMNWLMTNHAQSLRSRDGLYFVDFVNPHVGWTYHQNSPCLPAICPKEYQLLQTVDGGESWIERAIPGFEE